MVVPFRVVLEIAGYDAKTRDASGAEDPILISPTLHVGNPVIHIGHSGNAHKEKDVLTIVLVAHNVEVFPFKVGSENNSGARWQGPNS